MTPHTGSAPATHRGIPSNGAVRHGDAAAAPARAARSGAARRVSRVPRLLRGRRGFAPGSRRERQLSFNYARAFVEKGATYLVSEHRPSVTPIEDTPEGRRRAAEAERALLETWEANELGRLDLDGELDTAVLGDGAYKVTWDEREQRVVVSAPDVQGLFVWTLGDDVRRTWRVASRYEVAPEEIAARAGRMPSGPGGRPPASVTVTEAWTAERFELWVEEELVEARANPYGAIPFVIFPNLPRPKHFWGISDIEPLRESIVELNRALTQLSRIIELSGNPIAVLENVEESRDIAVRPGSVWELPEQSRAYLLDLLQGGGVRLHVDYVDLVYRTLHDLAETPRVAFGDGGGELRRCAPPRARPAAAHARKRLIRTTR